MFTADHKFTSGELQELFGITKWTVSRLTKDGLIKASEDAQNKTYSIGVAFSRDEIEGQAARAWLVAAAARREQLESVEADELPEQLEAPAVELPARVESGGGGASIEADEAPAVELPARVVEADERGADELPARVIGLASYRDYAQVFEDYDFKRRLQASTKSSLADYFKMAGIDAEQARVFLSEAMLKFAFKHYHTDKHIYAEITDLISKARHQGRMISYKITVSLIMSNHIMPTPRVVCVITGPPKMVVIELAKLIEGKKTKVQLCIEYQSYVQNRAQDSIKRAWLKALHDQRLESLGISEGVYLAAQASITQTLRELENEQANAKAM